MAKKEEKIVYMDLVDWLYEVGEAAGGNPIHASKKDLEECHPCVKSCGIARCKITLDKIVRDSDFSRRERNSSEKTMLKRAYKRKMRIYYSKILHYQKLLRKLEEV